MFFLEMCDTLVHLWETHTYIVALIFALLAAGGELLRIKSVKCLLWYIWYTMVYFVMHVANKLTTAVPLFPPTSNILPRPSSSSWYIERTAPSLLPRFLNFFGQVKVLNITFFLEEEGSMQQWHHHLKWIQQLHNLRILYLLLCVVTK